jgi:hypothetical protein
MNHGLLLGTLTQKFHRLKIFWMGFYLTGRTQRVWVGDYLSETKKRFTWSWSFVFRHFFYILNIELRAYH